MSGGTHEGDGPRRVHQRPLRRRLYRPPRAFGLECAGIEAPEVHRYRTGDEFPGHVDCTPDYPTRALNVVAMVRPAASGGELFVGARRVGVVAPGAQVDFNPATALRTRASSRETSPCSTAAPCTALPRWSPVTASFSSPTPIELSEGVPIAEDPLGGGGYASADPDPSACCRRCPTSQTATTADSAPRGVRGGRRWCRKAPMSQACRSGVGSGITSSRNPSSSHPKQMSP